MKWLTIAWLTCVLVLGAAENESQPLVVHSEVTLKWIDANPPGTAAHFIVQVLLGENIMESQRVEGPSIKVRALLGKLVPGEYRLRIITVDRSGVASKPSAPLPIAWVGNGLG